MKYGILSALVALVALGGSLSHAGPEETLIVPEIMYVPQGFDNNDSVELFFEGYLPDTCHKSGPISASVNSDNNKKQIIVEILAYNYFSLDTDIRCLPVISDYSQGFRVGLVEEPGEYEVMVKNQFGDLVSMGKLPIGVALTPTPDAHLYAPVKEVTVKQDVDGKNVLTLKGTFPNPCMKFENIIVGEVEKPGDVLDILPQIKITSEACIQIPEPFEETVTLPEISRGRYLIHVRTMNGNAVFKPFNF